MKVLTTFLAFLYFGAVLWAFSAKHLNAALSAALLLVGILILAVLGACDTSLGPCIIAWLRRFRARMTHGPLPSSRDAH
jgi:hypothetical protein